MHAKKQFGQNFLIDEHIIQAIVQAASAHSPSQLIEIGPGRGALTWPLLKKVPTLIAIEIDRDCASALSAVHRSMTTDHTFKLVNQDVLTADFKALAQDKPYSIVGNLPYNISSPILFKLFEELDGLEQAVVMLQKEVGDRLGAAPGSKIYGRLSVMAQSYVNVEALFDVPPEAFDPAPKINSQVLRLTPRATPMMDERVRPTFAKLVLQAFSQRRKTLRNTLKSYDKNLLEQAGIDLSLRAETIPVALYAKAAKALALSRP